MTIERLSLEDRRGELSPCPFCGDEPYDAIQNSLGTYRVACPQCGACGPDDFTYEAAIAAWNRRLPPPPTKELT